jgi:iron complex transport system ATP-binding protein
MEETRKTGERHGALANGMHEDLPRQDHQELVSLEGLMIGYRHGRKEQLLSGPLSCSAGGGELIALMGRNGCGKSTLLRTVAGLQESLRGRVILQNRPLPDYSRRELSRLLGFVSTEVVRVQGLRVRDLVAMGRYPHTGWFGNLSENDYEQIRHAMELTSMEPLADRDLDELSDGERQRAMIARTLAQDTRIMVLDEPTAFLDVTHRYEIVSLLGDLSGNHGKTIVFSSHDLHLSIQVADKIWLMMGQDILEGAPEDLVLSGKLEEGLLSDGAAAGFTLDPATGDLVPAREPGQPVSVSAASEELRLWTSRSLERMGFRPDGKMNVPLHVRGEGEKGMLKWILEKSGSRMEFNSIYELSLYLRTIV